MIAVIPAAGIGQRMGAALPKQYLECAGATLLDHTISALFAESRIQKIYIALQPDDHWFASSRYVGSEKVERVDGGDTRSASVLNALSVALATFSNDVLVAVHDAARPCLPPEVLRKLLDVAYEFPAQGALLAIPVRDTVKYVADTAALNVGNSSSVSSYGQLPIIARTLDRENIWLAQTPQVFRLGDLQRALVLAEQHGVGITDEASAMEAQGIQPILVPGSRMVMKVTDPEDLELIEFYLSKLKRG